MKKLIIALLILSTQTVKASYKLPLVENKLGGPFFFAEFVTAAENKRLSKDASNDPLASKPYVSLLVIPKIKELGPDYKKQKNVMRKALTTEQKDANPLDVQIADEKNRLMCQIRSREVGSANEEFYGKFNKARAKKFPRYKDDRQAVIFEFGPDCFLSAAKKLDLIIYTNAKDYRGVEYRNARIEIPQKFRDQVAKDFNKTPVLE